jgi:hypothetical protein
MDLLGVQGERVRGDDGYYACVYGSGHASPFFYDEVGCDAGSLCAPPCNANEECPAAPGGPAPLCRPSTFASESFGHCVLPCATDVDCPDTMVCGWDQHLGRTCFFPDVPWIEQCQ